MHKVAGLLGLNQASSLARRFLLASLAVLVVGGLTVGWWIGGQLERGIVDRTASITGLYVQSFIEPHLESLANDSWLSDEDIADLDDLLGDTAFGQRVVALKVWRPDGAIVYSPDRSLIGQSFPVEDGLRDAVNGNVVADMSALEADENVSEQARGFSRLLEMYLPVRQRGGGRIIAVAEFYVLPTEIDQEVSGAQLRSWLVVGGAVTLVYLLLFGIVRQGSQTIDRQRVALEDQVTELSTLLQQNEQLRRRVRVAAERTTTLGERNLRRISSDLHDGPGQMMALAMLRLDQLRADDGKVDEHELAELQSTLSDALRDMRAIAAGLRLPELSSLSTADTLRRAVDDHVRRTGVPVALTLSEPPREASLPTKIALFRATQELLSNATRHGAGHDVALDMGATDGRLSLTVTDGGPGFGETRVGEGGHLGLAGIREQAELLGGTFEIGQRAGGGAQVTVRWPL
jgi:signal transduction histidine kinase